MIVAIVLLATTRSVAGQVPCSYDVTVLPNVGCFGAPGSPIAINNLGHVLLKVSQCAEPQYDDARLWTGGSTTILIPRPPGYLGFTPMDFNDHDVIVGYAAKPSSMGGGYHGAIYNLKSAQWTIISPINGDVGWSGVYAVSNTGDVCGYRSIGSDGDPVNPQTAIKWSRSRGITDMSLPRGASAVGNDLNNDGIVVGTMFVNGMFHPFLWDDSQVIDLPTLAGFSTRATSINNSSIITGYGNIGPGFGPEVRAFTGDMNGIQSAGTLPRYGRSFLVSVNDAGIAIGECRTMDGSSSTAIVFDGQMLQEMDQLANGWDGLHIWQTADINQDGAILASSSGTGGNRTVVLTPAPVAGDLTSDCVVNVFDILAVIQHWGETRSLGDVDGDGVVGVSDILYVIIRWTG